MLKWSPSSSTMLDPFGRRISYLRVSVTDRCDFRCVYCMAEDMTFLPKADLLTLEELDRLCSVFITKGVNTAYCPTRRNHFERSSVPRCRSQPPHSARRAISDPR